MLSAPDENDTHRDRRIRLDQVIAQQRAFLHRVPDPDTRERAEGHLVELVLMRRRLDFSRLEPETRPS